MLGTYYGWARFGGYECSSRGDRRFSAMFAEVSGKTIEEWYQCTIKGYNTRKEGKGNPSLNGHTRTELWEAYLNLWIAWAVLHPDLMRELAGHAAKHNNVLSDMFATSEINQAHALAHLLNNEHLWSE